MRNSAAFGLLLILILFPSISGASTAGIVKDGNRLYLDGQYSASLDKYREGLEKLPNSDILNFNAGAACYKEEEYEEAVDYFRKSLLGEGDTLKEKAYYNLGNTLYHHGIGREDSDLPSAVKNLEDSIREYEKAMAFNPKDEGIKFNHGFVTDELKRLKEKLQKQQEQRKKQKQQEEDQQSQCKNPQQDQDKNNGEKSSAIERQEDNSGQQGEKEAGEDQQQMQQPQEESAGEEKGEEDMSGRNMVSSGDEKEGSTRESESSVGEAGTQQMSKEEARMLLENYQQNEEPGGLLNLFQKKIRVREPEKDW